MMDNICFRFIKRRGPIVKIRVFLFVVLIVLLAWYVSAYWYQLLLIQGESMEPAFHNLQIVLLKKYITSPEIERGDVVAFECSGLSSVLVKRVVALPGDTIVIKDEILYVNGEVSPIYKGRAFSYAGVLKNELIVPSDCFIVIGDNIQKSKDSRYEEVGTVSFKDVIGKIL